MCSLLDSALHSEAIPVRSAGVPLEFRDEFGLCCEMQTHHVGPLSLIPSPYTHAGLCAS